MMVQGSKSKLGEYGSMLPQEIYTRDYTSEIIIKYYYYTQVKGCCILINL